MPAVGAITTPGSTASKMLPLEKCWPPRAEAKAHGATRFCMGAAWREPKARDLEQSCSDGAGVKALGLETCATLGMLSDRPGANSSRTPDSTTTTTISTPRRSSTARLSPRANTRSAWIRWAQCARLASRSAAAASSAWANRAAARRPDRAAGQSATPIPKSVPINHLVQVAGTPLARHGAARPARIRAHHRRGAHHHAARARAPVGRPRQHGRGDAGPVFSRRRELDLLRRQAADHRQPGSGAGSGAASRPSSACMRVVQPRSMRVAR